MRRICQDVVSQQVGRWTNDRKVASSTPGRYDVTHSL